MLIDVSWGAWSDEIKGKRLLHRQEHDSHVLIVSWGRGMCLSMLDIWLWHSSLVSLLCSGRPSVMGKCARVCSKKPSSKVLKKPVGQIMKKPFGAIVPKRGKARALRRPSSSTSRSTSKKGIKYIQHNDKPEKKTKRDVSMMFVMTASQKQVIEKLKHTGWLSIIKKCPSCQTSLAHHRHRHHCCWQARCPIKKCGKRISWTCHHPLLQQGHGNLPLGQQAASSHLLGHPVWMQSVCSGHSVGGYKIHYPGLCWEAQGFGCKWSNFIGMIRRGSPSSLWISRLPDRTTSLKASGPGPIRSNDWVPIAKQMVAGKGVILHSDSAKAYMKPFARMTHTRVIHCKKFVKGSWTKPFYTKRVKVKRNKKVKHLSAGTQLIDGV